MGVALPLVHSEFGYGLDHPGHCVLEDEPGINGALHGVFHVSRIIEAINNPGSFAAITLESFVGGTPAEGPGIPVDPQAGNRTDKQVQQQSAVVCGAYINALWRVIDLL